MHRPTTFVSKENVNMSIPNHYFMDTKEDKGRIMRDYNSSIQVSLKSCD